MEIGKIIIAGGNSTRLGEDKVLIDLNGKKLLNHALDNLDCFGNKNIVVTSFPRDLRKFVSAETKIVYDFVVNGGPLSSIYTGLTYSTCEYNFVCACDMPFVNKDVVDYLIDCIGDYDIVIPQLGDGVETMHAIYSKRCYAALNYALSLKCKRLHTFLHTVNTKFVAEEEIRKLDPELKSIFNIDTKNDYLYASRVLGEK